MNHRKLPRQLLAVTAMVAMVIVAEAAWACEPPWTGWYHGDVFPAEGAQAAPLNGIVVARVQFVDDFSSQTWPEPDVVSATLDLALFRGEEQVLGQVSTDEIFGEVRFAADLPFAEGVTYRAELTLRNSGFDNGADDVIDSWTFTTGSNFDVAPPAFSGLQRLDATEIAQRINECCEPADPEFCLGACPPCQWCWQTDWSYQPAVELAFSPTNDEFGPETVRYAVRELSSPDDDPSSVRPRIVLDGGSDGVRLTVEGDGPWCYHVQARDVFAQSDNNAEIRCVDRDDIEPIDRLDVPPPDRSECADFGDDVGPDVGLDAGPDASADDASDGVDAGTLVDARDEEEGAVSRTNEGDGCGCRLTVPQAPPAGPLILLALFLIATTPRCLRRITRQ